jgi:hypothetical protein
MSSTESAIPGGQPSMTQPMAGPWDSPKFVTAKSLPRVLPDMIAGLKDEQNASSECSTQRANNDYQTCKSLSINS